MGHEEFGISHEEQLEIRTRAVEAALRDLQGPTEPNVASQDESELIDALYKRLLSEIMDKHGVDGTEARLILAEQIILNRTEGENNGKDF